MKLLKDIIIDLERISEHWGLSEVDQRTIHEVLTHLRKIKDRRRTEHPVNQIPMFTVKPANDTEEFYESLKDLDFRRRFRLFLIKLRTEGHDHDLSPERN